MQPNCHRPGHKYKPQYYIGPRPDLPPQRDLRTQHFDDHPDFTPDLTPEQMFRFGIFGGSYFRNIHSAITNTTYTPEQANSEFAWLADLPEAWYASPDCQLGVNYFGEFSGLSKEEWERSGWITEYDPYGWVQWYARFHAGRRCPDDRRQIERWLSFAGPRGRMRNMKKHSPKIKQALLQWAVFASK